jgi:predicted metal-binding protein
MSRTETNLHKLCKLAKKLGATKAVSFNADDVIVDERVRLKCRVPICDDYGLNLMCPPNVMSVQEFRQTLARYSEAILIQFEAQIPPEMREEITKAEDVSALYKRREFIDSYRRNFDPIKMKLHKTVHKVEAQTFSMGYRFQQASSADHADCAPNAWQYIHMVPADTRSEHDLPWRQ